MENAEARFIGVELYFENLDQARSFYMETLGLPLSDDKVGHHAKFGGEAGFVCLEKKGVEDYPSKDKAVLFFEVSDLRNAITAIGQEKIVKAEATWAVLHDPEGHNVLLVQRPRPGP
jgi:predicted enzyme related to lactoylglutathione lyase